VVLCLALGLGWPYLLLPVAPRRLLQVKDGFVLGGTVLGTRRVAVDGLTLRSYWFPLTRWPLDGQIYLLRDPRGRSLLLLEGYADRSAGVAVPDAARSVTPDVSELPSFGALMECERQRPITGRERLYRRRARVGASNASPRAVRSAPPRPLWPPTSTPGQLH